VKFTDRRDFLYDPNLFLRSDTKTAQKIYADYVASHTPQPKPKTLEVDRSTTQIDPMWHVPLTDRTPILRELELPMIVRSNKQKWTFDSGTKILIPRRSNQMTVAHNHLMELNYWPLKGDFIIYGGYRNIVVEVEVPLEAYWQQTNVWMGLVCHCEIAVEGDARPLVDVSKVAATEVSSEASTPLPPKTPPALIRTAE